MNNLSYLAKITKVEGNRLTLELKDELNIARLKTIFDGYDGERQAEIFIKDPRGFTVEQRKFFFALLNDIYKETGLSIDEMKDYIYSMFRYATGNNISLSNQSVSTVDDVSYLTNLVLDFIFEHDIPFKDGYEVPPQNIQYFFYKCLMTRTCCNCGRKPADIHHVDAVGMGNNRKKINNSGRRFMALCRVCHTKIHTEGFSEFTNKRLLMPIKLSDEDLRRLGLNVID
ncbi:putative HNHc nuclease [Enterococcus sp. AZ034]|uniref:putative HNHc nuclease n=1 Tax=Enterococcus sp. AZ034 TaxID=2774833 RepID=UPI003F1F4373